MVLGGDEVQAPGLDAAGPPRLRVRRRARALLHAALDLCAAILTKKANSKRDHTANVRIDQT